MRWDAVEIARFARGAGFVGDSVKEATAIALATSGGVATYDVRAGAPGVGHWVGLWGVDVDRWPEYADADLHVPQRAARAAHDLFEHFGGWSWAATYGTSHYAAMLEHAAVSSSQELRGQAAVTPFTIHHTDRHLRHQFDRLADVRRRLDAFRR